MSLTLKPLLLAVALLSAGCAIGPDYQRPELATDAAFKHQQGWTLAAPADALQRGAWWQLYQDPELDRLVDKLNLDNQNLAAAEAQYRQARALVRSARASFFPTLGSSASMTRSGSGGGNDTFVSNGTTISSGSKISKTYNLSLNAAWELDMWGKLRRNLEASKASYQASAAELAALQLSLQGELVQSYLQLRVLDEQHRLLQRTVEAYQRSLTLSENQYNAGIVPKSDVTQALMQLRSTQAQQVDLDWQRAQLEHAIAVLVGLTPAQLEIAGHEQVPAVPGVPLQVPSQLLERRPDIAAAERQVMAANAQIGVAKAAWFPDVSLSGSGGYRSSSFADWIELPNRFWSVGPQLALTLFDGGARSAEIERSEAGYDATVAQYRQTVLDSFREVEDALVQLEALKREQQLQEEAVQASRESLRLVENQYKAGTVDYISVASVQASALSNERSLLTVKGSQLTASVQLITALGGDWDLSKLEP